MESQHYTTEQVTQHLTDAREIVDALALPDDLRPKAFELAVNLLAQKTIMQAAPGAILLDRQH